MSQSVPDGPTESVRSLLKVVRAPSTLETTVTLSAPLGTSRLTLTYIPDRDVLSAGSFAAYANAHARQNQLPETLAAVIARDIGNELVPKWHRVTVTTTHFPDTTHTVTVEDRQPGWDTPAPPLTKG